MEEKTILFGFLLLSGVLNFVATENSFKDNVNSTSSCCAGLYFSSTGSLSNHEQKHVLGYYTEISDGPEAPWNYKQVEPSLQNVKLWYNPSIRAWFIGDHLGIH